MIQFIQFHSTCRVDDTTRMVDSEGHVDRPPVLVPNLEAPHPDAFDEAGLPGIAVVAQTELSATASPPLQKRD